MSRLLIVRVDRSPFRIHHRGAEGAKGRGEQKVLICVGWRASDVARRNGGLQLEVRRSLFAVMGWSHATLTINLTRTQKLRIRISNRGFVLSWPSQAPSLNSIRNPQSEIVGPLCLCGEIPFGVHRNEQIYNIMFDML
jgi:hypothetical protein